ncbi:MAG TPA: YHYH protein [Patescibacteria group bacterium]|nr:YHYH protein [Patescibacteria group bacterium]
MNKVTLYTLAALCLVVLIGAVVFATSRRSRQSQTQSSNQLPVLPIVTPANPQPESSETATPQTTPQTPVTQKQIVQTDVLDIHALPLGDGMVSSFPKSGYVYSCQTSFNGGGADHAGSWISGTTWDLTKKISVQGSVAWPNAVFSAIQSGISRVLSGNGLPVNAITGIFPIQTTDPAYQYDRNPNSIETQKDNFTLPANPTIAATPSCVPMGAIGFALNGVAIYNALDDAGRDAVAHEVQDSCNGHPQSAGEYHYHGPSSCMPHEHENNALVGYALDGFGIFSPYDANGREYANADLDECHGITSEISWNGKTVNMYHYVLTREYPYTIGCFRGTPVPAHTQSSGTRLPPPPK